MENKLIRMSFYRGTLNKEKLKSFIENTDKPIRFTYGLSMRNPTTNKVLVSKKEALEIVDKESLLDADEYEDT